MKTKFIPTPYAAQSRSAFVRLFRTTSLGLAGLLIYFTIAVPASAAVLHWSAVIDQAQEIPVPSPVPGAGGSAFGTIDTVTGLFRWNISYAGLSGPAVKIHFHGPAPAGVAPAPLQVDAGVLFGLVNPNVGMANLTAAQVSDVVDSLWYINVHTDLNAPGEIRGQVTNFVPEPATSALLALGLLGIAARRARRHS